MMLGESSDGLQDGIDKSDAMRETVKAALEIFGIAKQERLMNVCPLLREEYILRNISPAVNLNEIARYRAKMAFFRAKNSIFTHKKCVFRHRNR